MSNVNAPFGLKWTRHKLGAVPNVQLNNFPILYSYGTAIFKGSLVSLVDGYVNLAAPTDTAVLGVFDGCEWYDSSTQFKRYSKYWPAPGTAIANTVIAHVIIDPFAIYEIISSGAVITQANVGDNAKITAEVGNTITGLSTMALDQGTIGDNAYPLRIESLSLNGTNDNTASYNRVEVSVINSLALTITAP